MREEEHIKETEILKQECLERGDIWLTPSEADMLAFSSEPDHDRSLHGYCVSLSPVLLKNMRNLPSENLSLFLHQANCFYDGKDAYGRPMFYDQNLQTCVKFEQHQENLMKECTDKGNKWFMHGDYGLCIDFETAQGHPLGLLRKHNARTLSFKFNSMHVDLFRKAEFDRWFETEMTDAPQ